MQYIVAIKYNEPTLTAVDAVVAPICSIYNPTNSYTDTAAYDGTVYDTNVAGFGKIKPMEPFASTSFPYPVPMAQFKVAALGGAVAFLVDDYKEAFYYEETGKALADQGFEVTVTSEGNFTNVTGVTLATATVAHGTDLVLTPTIAPTGASVDGVIWTLTSAGTTGATLDNGVLKTTAAGTAKVKATIKGAVLTSGVLSDYTSSELSITVS